jgi:two-component system, NarL family, invasion response regulator UvrY
MHKLRRHAGSPRPANLNSCRSPVTRVLVADHRPIVRTGLRTVLEKAPDLEFTAEATHCDEIIPPIERNAVDIILFEPALPSRRLEMIAYLRQHHPNMPVLVFAADSNCGLHAIKAGATGFLSKEAGTDELLKAIRAVAQQREYVSEALAAQLASYVRAGERRQPSDQLSPRELQVAQMITAGKANKEIAADLRIAPSTAGTYRKRILQKLGLSSVADLIKQMAQYLN